MTKSVKELENILQYEFKNKDLLNKALTHKSYSENNNEKLEFLGDRVLGLVISKKLLDKYPNEKEGIIDKKFANLDIDSLYNNIYDISILDYKKFDIVIFLFPSFKNILEIIMFRTLDKIWAKLKSKFNS